MIVRCRFTIVPAKKSVQFITDHKARQTKTIGYAYNDIQEDIKVFIYFLAYRNCLVTLRKLDQTRSPLVMGS